MIICVYHAPIMRRSKHLQRISRPIVQLQRGPECPRQLTNRVTNMADISRCVRTSSQGEPVDKVLSGADDGARKRTGTVAATLHCRPALRVSSSRASAEGFLPEVASQNRTVSRARWLRTSGASSGSTSVDADTFWPHRPAAAGEACRMHATCVLQRTAHQHVQRLIGPSSGRGSMRRSPERQRSHAR